MKEEEDYKGNTQRPTTPPKSELAPSTGNARRALHAHQIR